MAENGWLPSRFQDRPTAILSARAAAARPAIPLPGKTRYRAARKRESSALMTRIPLKLDELFDGDALRRDLAAAVVDDEPASPATRAAVLQRLKDCLAEGRKVAERMLMADGGGLACAERLSHLMDEVIVALCDFNFDQRICGAMAQRVFEQIEHDSDQLCL